MGFGCSVISIRKSDSTQRRKGAKTQTKERGPQSGTGVSPVCFGNRRPLCWNTQARRLCHSIAGLCSAGFQPAVSPISKSAERPQSCKPRVWKPATQQTWKSALRGLELFGCILTLPHPGRADLPVCPNFTARERSEAGGRVDGKHHGFRFPDNSGGAAAPPYRDSVKKRPQLFR